MHADRPERIIATIEARMSSSRLPGKVLLPLGGAPALERLIERLKRSAYLDDVVVATTVNSADDAIVQAAERAGAKWFRGSEEDVLGRVLGAAQAHAADLIVEITGDCPLMDHRVVDCGIEEFFGRDVDYAANCLTQSYPLGFEVQVFPTRVLAEVDRKTQDPIDRTHVSYYIYMHPDEYRSYNWTAEPECHAPHIRVTLDEPDDYALIGEVFGRLHGETPDFGASHVVRLLAEHPDLADMNRDVRQKHAEEG
ncbi:MAG: glycosyltransferase family protein [Patescibacteria group bacterium]